MEFLCKPKSKKRRTRQTPTSKPTSKGKTKASVQTKQSCPKKKDSENSVKKIRPGPLCTKPKSTYKKEKLIILEKEMKEKIASGKAILDPKVCLNRIELGSFCHPFTILGNESKDETDSTSTNGNQVPPRDAAAPELKQKPLKFIRLGDKMKQCWKVTESDTSKDIPLGNKMIPGRVIDSDLTKLSLKDILTGKTEPAEEAEPVSESTEETLKDIPHGEKMQVETTESTIKKLKNIPSVTKSINGTPDELLCDIHFLLFLESAEMHKLKENILDFSGFPFDADSEEYDERRDFLERMSDKTVKDVARTFSLKLQIDKDETIANILSFLKNPNECRTKEGSASSALSDIELDIEDMCDSDDSLTCEVVQKKVECIDLISSGDESDKAERRLVKQLQQQQQVSKSEAIQETLTPDAKKTNPDVDTETKQAQPTGKRTLRNFETICKIVNTHPDEYLVDVFDLLYMRKYEPRTLRKEILDFSGFDFLKGSPEYIKRKLLLDRMLYNSVRRIYNTLIHNSTEVKIFSKPTMIGEIFDFLLKLPDHDTSIHIPRLTSKPAVPRPTFTLNMAKDKALNNLAANQEKSANLPINAANQSGKLSDLKRVFQRVACFPCEYLVDVHKLLFMTDCNTKVIRQNIFGFKGFAFGIDSLEFQQRKMYLEYLTFHSLRKISSVLTTKTVDLRNSTKHELANHLTEVLAEYTNTACDTEPLGEGNPNQQPETNPLPSVPGPSDPDVEKIVITPIIEPLCPSPVPSPEPPKTTCISSTTTSDSIKGKSILKSTEKVESKIQIPEQNEAKKTNHLAISIVDTRSLGPVTTTAGNRGKRKVSVRKESKPTIAPETVQHDPLQFSDINLPEVEKYRQIYGQNLNIYPQNIASTTLAAAAAAYNGPAVLPQAISHYTHTLPIPIIHSLSSQSHSQNQVYAVRPPISAINPLYQVECVLGEEPATEPTRKKAKTSPCYSKKKNSPKSLPEEAQPSFHDKIRDAMNDVNEEECDKPLASFLGHPNDRILKQQICEIVEQTDLQDITINGVIHKIFDMYPKFDLSYRKEFIKSTLRSVLYKLGEQKTPKLSKGIASPIDRDSPDCSVSTTGVCYNPEQLESPPVEPIFRR